MMHCINDASVQVSAAGETWAHTTSNHLIWILYDLRFRIWMRADEPRFHVFIWSSFLISQSMAHFFLIFFHSAHNCTNIFLWFCLSSLLALGTWNRISHSQFDFFVYIFSAKCDREADFACDFFQFERVFFFCFRKYTNECVEYIYRKRSILLLSSKCIQIQ